MIPSFEARRCRVDEMTWERSAVEAQRSIYYDLKRHLRRKISDFNDVN